MKIEIVCCRRLLRISVKNDNSAEIGPLWDDPYRLNMWFETPHWRSDSKWWKIPILHANICCLWIFSIKLRFQNTISRIIMVIYLSNCWFSQAHVRDAIFLNRWVRSLLHGRARLIQKTASFRILRRFILQVCTEKWLTFWKVKDWQSLK